MQRISELSRRPGFRYLLVGGTVYVLELAIIAVGQWQDLSPVTAVAVAYCVGTFVSFLLQKLFTFGDKRMHRRVLGWQVAATTALVLFNLGFSLLATQLLQNVLPTVVIRTLALGITTIWNFYLYKTRIFKNAPELVS